MMQHCVLYSLCFRYIVFFYDSVSKHGYLYILSLFIYVFISVQPIFLAGFCSYQFLFLHVHFKTSDSQPVDCAAGCLVCCTVILHYILLFITIYAFMIFCVLKTAFSTEVSTLTHSTMSKYMLDCRRVSVFFSVHLDTFFRKAKICDVFVLLTHRVQVFSEYVTKQ